MKTDKLIYFLFQEAPESFFDLIGQSPEVATKYAFKSVEIKETALRIDAVFEPKLKDDPIYFVEAQFHKDEKFYARFFAEIFLFLRQNPFQKWKGIVIYPKKNVEQKEFEAYKVLLETTHFERIYLEDIFSEEDEVKNFNPKDFFQMMIQSEGKAAEIARNVSKQEPKFLDIAIRIIVNKLKDKTVEEIMDYLEEIDQDILENTVAGRQIVERIRKKAEADGLKAGMQQGMQQVKRDAVPNLLRLGLTPEQISGALNISIDEVKKISSKNS
ncbi:MAG: Rpn family recombination-promoting nuclease/putative transposase [Chloroherpetonaceae bacterium]|nr:Rpn family recombination-promoting nuclease/putative transposase [Chloroherpetonaceae bacterium]